MNEKQRLTETIQAENEGAQAAPPVAPSPAPPPVADGGCDGAPRKSAPKKRTPKAGAPPLNSNRQTHGLDSKPEVVAMRFELGALAGTHKRVACDVYAFRRVVENVVMDAKGSISFFDAALIQTACRHERASRLALAWLRQHVKDLTHAERLAYSKAIADSSAARDKTLERLKLDTEGIAFHPADIYKVSLEFHPQAAQQANTHAIDGQLDAGSGPASEPAPNDQLDAL